MIKEASLKFVDPYTGEPLEKPDTVFDDDVLFVNEIFTSISGEVGVIPQGSICSVLRLQGCNLTCSYCDAESSQQVIKQHARPVKELAEMFIEEGVPLLITGGEPLLQMTTLKKLIELIGNRIIVQIETNGTIDPCLPFVSCFVMDYKLDSPPPISRVRNLRTEDYLKFVVSSGDEIVEAFYKIGMITKHCFGKIAISATDVRLYDRIIRLIKQTDKRIITNVQIHKFLGAR